MFDTFPETFVQLLDELEVAIHVVDVHGKTVLYNQAASELDELQVEEVLGLHILDVYPSLTKKTSTLVNVVETGKAIDEQQQAYTNRKGKHIITVNKTFPLIRGTQIIGAVEVAKDITHVKKLSDEVMDLRSQMKKSAVKSAKIPHRNYQFKDIVTQSKVMLREIEKGKRASNALSPVLVIGETGTGKELIVQSIHHNSKRKNMPFIVQNCAAIPSALLEGILFGTTRGAFTGAEDRPGLFELAHGGTLFLDEIQAMPVDVQAKLLRSLEEGVIRRVGGMKEHPVDVRIIVAINENPLESIEKGELRKDLFYRIHVVGIHLPPLRERKEDISLLTTYFLKTLTGNNMYTISSEVMDLFQSYDWPGNVRELKHTIEGAINISSDIVLTLDDLPSYFRRADNEKSAEVHASGLNEQLLQLEKAIIQKAMAESEGNIKRASSILGIPRQTLQYKLKKTKERHYV